MRLRSSAEDVSMPTPGRGTRAGTPRQGEEPQNWRATVPSTGGHQPQNWTGTALFFDLVGDLQFWQVEIFIVSEDGD